MLRAGILVRFMAASIDMDMGASFPRALRFDHHWQRSFAALLHPVGPRCLLYLGTAEIRFYMRLSNSAWLRMGTGTGTNEHRKHKADIYLCVHISVLGSQRVWRAS